MWKKLGLFVIKFRLPLLFLLAIVTAIMAFFASKVSLSYEFAKAIPVDNPKYQDYKAFRDKFGDDGNVLVIGIESAQLFTLTVFKDYQQLQRSLKTVSYVEDVLSVPAAINLQKDSVTEKLQAVKIFSDTLLSQKQLDCNRNVFFNLPFYRSLLYNRENNAYLMAVRINKEALNSPKRSKIVSDIKAVVADFEARTKIQSHLSGLPLIRTVVADRLQKEMKIFLIGSVLLSALILLLFFRSFSTMLLSLAVVVLGVVWTLGVLYLCGYKISLLTALTPPLVVVIGIPNCIYFINKYHTSFLASGEKNKALVDMVSKMGIVTLFCNISAAIGFAVFSLTKSTILQEFGVVAGISIMLIFVISFILLPAVLSYLPSPKPREMKYLNSRLITGFLLKTEQWAIHHKKTVYLATFIVVLVSIAGIFRLKTVAYIVDDLPRNDKIYTDLKFFERNFKGVMPLEIVVDTKKRNGLTGMRALVAFEKIDSLSKYIADQKEMSRPLSLAEGLKFVKQAFYEGDSSNYLLPNSFDGAFVGEYLRPSKTDTSKKNNFSRLLTSFMDTARQSTRLSVNMADIGTQNLPLVIKGIQDTASKLFDSSQYEIHFTGTSITFLEGSSFIIGGLKESILWAFLLISACMLYLFKSARILVCSLIPNLIPLLITAGIMGWAGVPLKPSTVLVFSVALGIAIDITIRFLINYKQELPVYNNDVEATVRATIRNTGLSIVYTSLVLIAGFVIFCFSSFGGTFALGWLTSVTLLIATITNLVLLPVLLLNLRRNK
ncbi:MAG: MMPL family transporter [Ferruginibacter sp.]|nr:MMPL family transporter [Ferruginibacter sp.]